MPTPTPIITPTPTPAPTPSGRTNVALSANGGIASASSQSTGGSPHIAIDGSRSWAIGGAWKDATPNSYPDILQVDFNGSRTIDEIDVYLVQDDYNSTAAPTLNTTFSIYGITSFDIQYFNGSVWATVPGGNITNNNKVLTKLTFSPVTTSRIRVVVNNAQLSYSRIVELEAWGGGVIAPTPTPIATPTPIETPTPTPSPTPIERANVALTSNGGVASASSQSPGGSPGIAIDGSRNWAIGGAWKDATPNSYPDFLQINFNGSKTINEIDVYLVRDDYSSTVDPTLNTTFSVYGISSFDLQYWNGSGWITLTNGNITNNDKVWTKLVFSPVTTTSIRVVVNNAQLSYSRIVEVEAWSGGTSNSATASIEEAAKSDNRIFSGAMGAWLDYAYEILNYHL